MWSSPPDAAPSPALLGRQETHSATGAGGVGGVALQQQGLNTKAQTQEQNTMNFMYLNLFIGFMFVAEKIVYPEWWGQRWAASQPESSAGRCDCSEKPSGGAPQPEQEQPVQVVNKTQVKSRVPSGRTQRFRLVYEQYLQLVTEVSQIK